ncbi:MAG TPA: zf-HC2 domain-containing protein [Kofleriaceae bacterium]|nr:zf-HC2 domain-containing protein [Kofleriaceae bacterium]
MTRCGDVDRLVTAYVDGELDDQRSSAVRGHLRVCTRCAERVEDEARVRELAADLEPIDPPQAMWRAIDARLADAEIGDSHRSTLSLTVRRWLDGARRNLLPLGVGAAAVAVLLVLLRPGGTEGGDGSVRSRAALAPAGSREPVVGAGAPVGPGCAAARSHEEQVLCQMHESDKRYLDAIGELHGAIAEERATWSAADAARFDSAVARLDRAAEIERVRLAGSVGTGGPAARDPLHAIYREKIELLTSAVVTGDLAFASTPGGGR